MSGQSRQTGCRTTFGRRWWHEQTNGAYSLMEQLMPAGALLPERGLSRNVDEDLADRTALHRIVRDAGLAENEAMQW